MATFDVVVVGVGGMGAAVLDHAARRGLRAVGVDREEVPGTVGSSLGETRIIRLAYWEDPRYVPLLRRAYELWYGLEAWAGRPLLTRVGCLNVGPAAHPAMVGVGESVRRHGLDHEWLDAAEMRRRYPGFSPGDGDVGLFEGDGGVLAVEACTRAHADRARAHGARIETGVVADVDGTGVRLVDGRRFSAGAVVVCAGAWLPALSLLSTPMVPERNVQLWFDAPRAAGFPALLQFTDDGAYYAIPPGDDGAMKVCEHHTGISASPETVDREVYDSDETRVRAYIRRHLPVAVGPRVRARVCLYTNTPDGHFAIGRRGNMTVLGGFSGHGYKFASVMGEIAVDLATTGASRFDLGLFDPARFDR